MVTYARRPIPACLTRIQCLGSLLCPSTQQCYIFCVLIIIIIIFTARIRHPCSKKVSRIGVYFIIIIIFMTFTVTRIGFLIIIVCRSHTCHPLTTLIPQTEQDSTVVFIFIIVTIIMTVVIIIFIDAFSVPYPSFLYVHTST